MIATGTTGFLILVAVDTIRGCSAGHAPSALLSALILGILSVEVWAIAPAQFGLDQSQFRYALGWVVAIAPFAFLARGFIVHRRATESRQKNAEQAGAGQPATRPVAEPEGGDKPKSEAEGRCP